MRRLLLLGLTALLTGCGATSDAKEAVAAQLKDPASAQFKDVRKVKDYVCGEVNGKNAYGGYVGFKRFFVTDLGGVFIEPDEAGEDQSYFRLVYSSRCSSSG